MASRKKLFDRAAPPAEAAPEAPAPKVGQAPLIRRTPGVPSQGVLLDVFVTRLPRGQRAGFSAWVRKQKLEGRRSVADWNSLLEDFQKTPIGPKA